MPQERLTDEDITELVGRMLDLSSTHQNYPFTKLFTLAQEVLPAHKRYRKSVVVQRTKWSKKLQQALKGAGLWPGYQPLQEPPAPPAPTPAPATEVTTEVTTEVEAPSEQSVSDLLQRIVERVMSDMLARITPEIDHRVKTRLQEILSVASVEETAVDEGRKEVQRTIEREAMPVSVRRVFVMGLLPEQILALRQKIRDLPLEMRFWKNESQSKLIDNAEWADDIFVMTKFVSHSDIHAVRNRGREKIKYCNGAVSELDRQIRFEKRPLDT